ncbi:MAG: Gfo/Idh/MocA family protein [Gemmatimonadota bacterium]
MIRFAIVGHGRIAAQHAAAIEATDEACLVAVADPDALARRSAEERWNCRSHASIDRLLAEEEIDAAIVCTPPALHLPHVERLLFTGQHVLCEKPLAPTSRAARAMVQRAGAAGRTLMASTKFCFVPDLHEARRRVEGGEIGRPLACEVAFCAPVAVAGGWMLRPELSGGGVVMDNGTHAFDVLATALGADPVVLSAAFGPRVASPSVEDAAEIQIRIGEGIVGRIALSWSHFTKDLDYFVIHGTDGTIRVGWPGSQIRRHGDREWVPFGSGYDKTREFASQLQDFLSVLRGGRPSVPPEQAVKAVEFVEGVYRAEDWAAGLAGDADPRAGTLPR